MAEAAVWYVLEKLADVLLKKAQELHAVSGQIKQMQLEFGFIKAFLKDADSKSNRNESVKEWVNQIRNMAHRIEDVIDTFLVEIEESGHKSSHWYSKIPMGLKKPYKINKRKLSGELEEITVELKKIYDLRINLGIKDLGDSEENGQHQHQLLRPTKPDDFVDSEVVGLEDDKRKIINQLLDTTISRRMVLSIVGTGGLGKTTLAQKIYKSVDMEGKFDRLAWLSISQKFNQNDLFREILYSIEPEMRNQKQSLTDDDVRANIKSTLSDKRYLIILDDVWTTDVWELLKVAIPDPKNMSRIIITSRFEDVATAADCNTEPYQLNCLNSNESLALLFRKAFQQPIQPENYPRDVLEVAKSLTKKCGGLPLALVVLGGILSRKRNYPAWKKMEETMDWHDNDGKKCSQVLAMSYENLPYKLKPCFLYLACFPEDYKISGEHITRMWMAEGFIPKDGAGTIEDRAEKCLEELVQRCLIQVTKKSWNSNCKYCIMHDLLRDLAIHKAKDENFFTVFSKEEDVNNLAASKPRRAALQLCTPTEDGIYSENTRSLLCFGFGQWSSNNSGFGLLNYSGFRLLRVLTLESVDMTTFTRRQWPKGLIHLRYLGLRDCYIPHDIFKKFSFYNLETIDLKGTKLIYHEETPDLCDVVIPTLRHIYGSGIYLPIKWDMHTNLQTIMNVSMQMESIVELGFCINLRTLVISIKDKLNNGRAIKECQNLKRVLRRTEQLLYLTITTHGFLPFGGTKDLPCHGRIQNLFLCGVWARNIYVPSVEMFPTNLTKLKLVDSKLQEDPMPILEKLQSLRILYLFIRSYVGTELICSTGGFPSLEKLKLSELSNLHHWDIKEGAMPILRHLKIDICEQLQVLPELQKVRTLQELTVDCYSHALWKGKDLHKIKHIPSVHIRVKWAVKYAAMGFLKAVRDKDIT